MSGMHKLIAGVLIAGSVATATFTNVKGSQMVEFSSPWQDSLYARARLIATGYPGTDNDLKTASAGVHIEIDPGWKTYWRNPGGSGIPTQPSWEGSTNVKSIEVRWPAPKRLIDKYGMTIGYKNEIVLPVKIVPVDAKVPVRLSLDLNYAVCLDICLPVNAKMALDIKPENQSTSPFKRKLARFIKKIPQPSKPSEGLRVRKLDLTGDGKNVTLLLEIENPTDDALVDVFVEGADALFFNTPEKIINKGAVSLVEMSVSGAKSAKALEGNKLRFTLVGEKTSVDQYWTIGG